MALKQRTILIIAADAADRAAWRSYLQPGRGDGWVFIEAATAAEGRAALRSAAPECLLLSATLPETTAKQALNSLCRQSGRLLPVIVIGDKDDEAMSAAMLRQGAQEYLCRAHLRPAVLRRTVRNVIERTALHRELAARNRELEKHLRALEEEVAAHRRAEQELEHYRLLAANTRDIMLFMRPDGRIVEANQAAIAAYGYSEDELRQKTLFDLRDPDTRPEIAGQMQQAEQAGIFFETVHRRRDGTTFAVEVGARGAVIGGERLLVSVVRDVSERRRAEESLRHSEELFRTMANTAPTFIWTAAPDGTITFQNQQWLSYTGLSPEENGWSRLALHPDDYDRCRSEWNRALLYGLEYQIEVRNRRHDGVYRWFLTRATPVRDAAGRITAWVGSTTDIHDRKEAEETLRVSEERLEMALAAGHAGTWDWKIPANELSWSDEHYAMFGLTPGEVTLSIETFINCIHPDDRLRVVGEIQQVLEECCEIEHEFRIIWPDGSVRSVHSNGTRINDEHGEPVRLVGITLDITERRMAEQEREKLLRSEHAARETAEQAARARDEFVAVVSHELRSPLNAMLGWTKVLRGGKADEATTQHALEIIERSVRMQQQLVEDLLDTARITSGKLRIETGPVDLEQVINAAAEVMRPAAEARGVDLYLELQGGDNVISGDADRLQQVVWNLLSNAIKFTSAGGRVTVRLERTDPQMQITVSDTGKGIRPDLLPFVFDRFQQSAGAGMRRQGGLGLGLALVKHLVELHGGTVRADSPGEGQGATLTVMLPLRALRPQAQAHRDDELATAAIREDREPEAARLLSGIRVLIVDDEADAREMVTLLLRGYGAEVTTAASAPEALQVVRDRTSGRGPEVLVTDIGLPGQDGYWLIEQLRALAPEAGGRIPAIALTAFGRASDRIRALSAGFQMHIPKPVEPAELTLVIARLTGKMEKGVGI